MKPTLKTFFQLLLIIIAATFLSDAALATTSCVPDAPAGISRSFRSSSTASLFKRLHPGVGIVDHTCALDCGGLDVVGNMQWQSVTEAARKDRIESTTAGRKLFCNTTNSLPYRTIWNNNSSGRKAVLGK